MFEWTPDKSLSWSEPARVRHTFYPSTYLRSWAPIAIAGSMLVLWLLLWLIVPRPSDEPAYQGLIICLSFGLVFGILFGYGIGLLLHICPTTIGLDNEGIERTNPIFLALIQFGLIGAILMALGTGRKRWTWKQIQAYRITTHPCRGRDEPVIEFLGQDNAVLARAGLGSSLKRERLLAKLQNHRCPPATDEPHPLPQTT